LSSIDGSYGPFVVSVVSTNDANKVANEITYDSNSEFGYIIVGSTPTNLNIKLERTSA